MGLGRKPRPRWVHRQSDDAAGDGQPASPTWVFSPRRSQAGLKAATASSRCRCAHLDHHIAVSRRDGGIRHCGHDHRHGVGFRRRCRRRGRGLDRRRLDVAHGDRPGELELRLDAWFNGIRTVRSRAVDDSGNLETPSAGVLVTATAPSGGIPAEAGVSIWDSTYTPPRADFNNGAPIELGVKFRSDQAGSIIGLRFNQAFADSIRMSITCGTRRERFCWPQCNFPRGMPPPAGGRSRSTAQWRSMRMSRMSHHTTRPTAFTRSTGNISAARGLTTAFSTRWQTVPTARMASSGPAAPAFRLRLPAIAPITRSTSSSATRHRLR